MPFAAALSEHPDAAHAIGEATGRVLEQLPARPDVAMVFVTATHEAALPSIVHAIRTILEPALLIGCSAVSVVGVAREVEEAPAMSLWAGVTGGVEAVRLTAVPVGQGEVGISGWPDADELPFEPSALVLLADPYSFPAEAFLAFVDEQWPGLPVVGGMASAARTPGGARLVLDGELVTSGAVGAFLGPGVEVEPVVSQGCRPVGEAWSVTAADGNVVRGLGGRPPLERLAEVVRDAGSFDAHLLTAGGLHVGRVIDEHKAEFGRGDFLVRNVLGGDQSSGAIAIADHVEVGTTLQFHVRDAVTADEDLRALLVNRSAHSALLFTCNGRGVYTFGEPDHDAGVLAEQLGTIPAAGFFAAGEFGPVSGRNFLHGFTASIALLRDRVTAG
ncbi:MAG TPA: FIST N-terminal domain-containing protein [Acidimicrobiales bacterium]